MACDKKINNKIKLSKFWAMGGVCVVELWPDLPYRLGKPWWFAAGSTEEFYDIKRQIEKISDMGTVKYGLMTLSMNLVRGVSFRLDGFYYECNGYNVWDLEDDDYLKIKERGYK